MDAVMKRVEAVLFAVGKEITSERIASLCSMPVEEVEKTVQELIQEYQQKDQSLQVVKKDNGWKLTVRDEYVPLVSNLVSSTELEGSLMQTLAVIAWRYPILQADIIKLRGSGAYDHMKQLIDQGFIAKEKFQRTYKIKLTNKFFEYFDLPSAEAKQAFLNQVPPEVLTEAENVEKEVDETERVVEQDKKDQETRQEIKKAMDVVSK
ncbi:MAG TPA: SMC-Scp complex subunit ScpB [Candidatus Nanoarchaeia archaeon]|nr:SMC-Scp complex subunit ScpB [Candidatus Nanoarchaeia archaeon]